MRKILLFLFALFFAVPAMAACTGDQIDVLGNGTQCETAKFTLTTVANTTTFQFTMSAKGTFYVDCGNGGTLTSGSATNYPVNNNIIVDRTYGTSSTTYTCTWGTGATQTIRFGGTATDYSTGKTTAAISFYTTDAAKVASISGSLGQMFPVVNGNIPRFYQTFTYCTGLTGAIPSNLFSGIDTSSATDTSNMFDSTFYGCRGLTGAIPSNLFSGIDTSSATNTSDMFESTFNGCSNLTSIPSNLFSAVDTSSATNTSYMFSGTFQNCTGLTSIPLNLFSAIDTSKSTNTSYMFSGTFVNCSSLASVTNGNLSTTYIPADFMSGVTGTNFATRMFTNTALESCPDGKIDATPSQFRDAGKPWCDDVTISATYTVTYNSNKPSAATGNVTGTTANSTHTYGYSSPLTTNGYALNGYIFVGWATTANATAPEYTDGADVKTLSTTDGATVTLYAVWFLPPQFSLTTVANTTTFKFMLSAKGTFIVDCGNGGTLTSNSATNYPVNNNIIVDHTYGTDSVTYTCTWGTGATQTIRFGGTATDYNTGTNTAAISFNTTYAAKVASISGSLGQMFPVVNGKIPRFYGTFYGCTGLTSIPSNLFSGIDTSSATNTTNNMFYQTFYNCTNLTSIPNGLFSSIDTSSATDTYSMFRETFRNCTGLTSIPSELFSGIDTSSAINTSSMFNNTFYGCTSLARVTNGGTSTTYVPAEFLSNIKTTNTSVASSMFSNTALESPCPSGTITVTPSIFSNAGKPWCAVPTSYTVTYNANKPSGATGNVTGTTANSSHTYGTPSPLTPNGYALDGYAFAGWATTSGATTPEYADEENVTYLTSTDGGTVTLYAVWVQSKFLLITKPGTTTFQFMLSAKGTFYVDCGNGGTLTSGSPTNYPVNGTTVNHTYGTGNVTYTCTWTNGAVQIIRFDGTATDYNVNPTTAAISFYVGSNSSNALKVASIAGSLGQIFPVANGKIPRFYRTFSGCTGLTGAIPSGLFSGIDTSSATDTSNMFDSTFYGCTGLTGAIPNGLFSDIDTSSAINTNSMFYRTFYGCSNLSSVINGDTSTTYVPAEFLSNIKTTSTSVASSMFTNTALESPCPSGTNDVTPSIFSNAGKPWCAVPTSYTVTYNANKPSGATGNVTGTTADSTHTYGTPSPLTTNGYALDGYLFLGWATTAGATVPKYTDGEDVKTLSSTDGATVTLYAVWLAKPFTLTTVADTTTFQFTMSARGTFIVDCGNGGTLTSSSATNYPVNNGKIVNRTYGTASVIYTCTWGTGATQTIRFGGTATNYNTNTSTPAISFYVSGNSSNAPKVASIAGSLGQMFPVVNGNIPRFYETFRGCTGLTSIPSGLFSGIDTSSATNTSYMFRQTFNGCTNLTSIPSNLFSAIDTSKSTNTNYMFYYTFYGCSLLASVTNGNTSTTYIPGDFMSGITGTGTDFSTDMFANTALESPCPSDTNDVTPSIFSNAGKPWCEAVEVNCSAGQYLPANASSCATCPAGKYCNGGTYPTDTSDQGLTGNITAGYFCSGGCTTATPTSSSDCLSGNTCGQCTTDSTTGRPAYTDAAGGAASCSVCPAVTGDLASRVSGYSGWWGADNIHNTVSGCMAEIRDDDPDATYRAFCYYNSSRGTYGGANDYCQFYSNAVTACAAGKYKTIESTSEWNGNSFAVCNTGADCMKGKVCTNTTAGYYSPADALTQTACPAGTYSGAGASACTNVTAGYYATGCTNGTTCTGQSQCTGATYCANGVQNNCPTGYAANTTAGKSAISQCQTTCAAGNYMATGTYTKLEYLQSSETQYIDTGFSPDINTRVDYKIRFLSGQTETGGSPVIGARVGDGLPSRFLTIAYSSGTTFRTVFGMQEKLLNFDLNTDYEGSFKPADGVSIINGTTYDISNSGFVKSANNNLYLFATSGYGDNLYKSRAKIYYVKIWDGASLVRDFIPVRRNSDNVLGMLDLVSGTFFTNAGSGTFTAGPDVGPIGGTCTGTSAGYYTVGATVGYGTPVPQNACPVGTFAPTEASMCYPHILHVGNNNIYLKSTKQTTPSLNMQIGNDKFYAHMTTTRTKMNKDSDHYFHIDWGNNHYYMCDDTTCPDAGN